MLLAALPDGYAARVPTIADALAVTDLITECRLAVGDRSGMTVEELLGDVLNRSYVSISVNTFHCICAQEYVGRYWRALARVDQTKEAFAGRFRETRSTSPCEPPCRQTSLMRETRLAEERG